MFNPSRGGSRGGRDKFDWEELKDDKDRYNYLGNSLKARVKKPWDQGAEPGWYAKSPGAAETIKITELSEIELIKAKEREYMEMVMQKGFGFNRDKDPYKYKRTDGEERITEPRQEMKQNIRYASHEPEPKSLKTYISADQKILRNRECSPDSRRHRDFDEEERERRKYDSRRTDRDSSYRSHR